MQFVNPHQGNRAQVKDFSTADVFTTGTEDAARECIFSSIGRSAVAKAIAGQVPMDENTPSKNHISSSLFYEIVLGQDIVFAPPSGRPRKLLSVPPVSPW
jgi:hypothetical protein